MELLVGGLEGDVGERELFGSGAQFLVGEGEFLIGLVEKGVFLLEGFDGGLGFLLGFFEIGDGGFEGFKGEELADVVVTEGAGREEEGKGEGLKAGVVEEGMGNADDRGDHAGNHEGFAPMYSGVFGKVIC